MSNDLRDPSNPRSPYNRYNWDSPYSVTNPDSTHYNPAVIPPNVILGAVGFVLGLLVLLSGFIIEFLETYANFRNWYIPEWFRMTLVAMVLPVILVGMFCAGWGDKSFQGRVLLVFSSFFFLLIAFGAAVLLLQWAGFIT